MLQALKFKYDESQCFFISDLHWGHDKDFIWGKRGFTSIQESDETLIERWNATVPANGIVFHLGDFIFNDGTGKRFWELCRRLQYSQLFLLLGNHTSGQRQAYQKTLDEQHPQIGAEVYPLTAYLDKNSDKRITFLPQYVEVVINSTQLVLCHYPIISHNNMGKGSIHLTGHSHGACDITNANTGRGFRLDCGVESFGCPISLVEVKRHLQGRDLDSPDHHNASTVAPRL